MRVWFRRPNGKMRCYEASYDDPMIAIAAVRQHDPETMGRPCLVVIDGEKPERLELPKESE